MQGEQSKNELRNRAEGFDPSWPILSFLILDKPIVAKGEGKHETFDDFKIE